MANLTEVSNFDAGVYQIEVTDPVQGGSSGIINTPLKNLANRTKWLYDQLQNGNGGATGAGGDKIFALNGQTVTTSYSIPAANNAVSVGPISIATGVTVTVPAGSRWVIL